MITPILILSVIFIVVAFIVNEKNAKYILSGYNTMSEEEMENFDLKNYLLYFRNFHIFLGLTILIISLILLYFGHADWSGMFLGTFPLLAYVFFIWKSYQFTKQKSKKQKATMYITMSLIFLLFVAIIYAFKSSIKDNEMIVDAQKIEITGDYGTEIEIWDLKSIELINRLPEISSKINGFALETIKKGYFKTENNEKVKLLINSKKTPVILLITNDNQKIYYSSKDKSNEEIYNYVKRKVFNQ